MMSSLPHNEYDPASDIIGDLQPETDAASDQLLAFLQDAATIDDQRNALEFWAQYQPLTADEQAELDQLNQQGEAFLAQACQQGLLLQQLRSEGSF